MDDPGINATTGQRATDALVGSWLRGKYRLDRVLGEGGMATVYAATHRNKKRFAVKMLHSLAAAHPDVQARFLREGYVANTVDHPGAVAVLDDDVSGDGVAFIVMELLDGLTVEELAPEGGPRPSLAVTLNVAFQVLDILAAAHDKGIIHRDVKPANLFLTTSGQLKILDFGIARLREVGSTASATQTGTTLGTPAFMGPEQALGRTQDIDARTDVWAVGASLFWLLSGRSVHLGDTVQHMMVLAATAPAPPLASVCPGVHPRVAAIVDRALAFDRAARWPSAAAMRDAVSAAHREICGQPVSPAAVAGLAPSRLSHPGLDPSEIPQLSDPALAAVRRSSAAKRHSDAIAPTQLLESDVRNTAVPVSSGLERAGRRRRSALVVASSVAAAVALLGVGWVALRARSGAPAPASEAAVPASSPPAASASDKAAPPVAPATGTAAPPPTELPVASSPPATKPEPPSPPAPSRHAARPGSTKPSPAPSARAPNSDFDRQ